MNFRQMYALVTEGIIRGKKVGREWRIYDDDLFQWKEETRRAENGFDH